MSLACYSYNLSFVTPLTTSTKTFDYRRGFILSHTAQGHNLYGEVAPLPGFSEESYDEVQQMLIAKKDLFQHLLQHNSPVTELQEIYTTESIPPSLQFGLDSLAYQIEAHQAGKSLVGYLFSDISTNVPVNVLISLQDGDPIPKIKQHMAMGYQTIKCKVGLDTDRELYQLSKIRNHFPDLTIRIDANQAWSLNQAIELTNKFQAFNIEYCEEPLARNTPAQLEELSQNTDLPIALDETIAQHAYWPNLLPFTQYLIIKPMVIGSFRKNIETKRLANTHNNKVVVTTSLESGVGRYITGILAAGIGSSQTAHGLATESLFSEHIYPDDSFISNGFFRIINTMLPVIDFKRQHIFSSLF